MVEYAPATGGLALWMQHRDVDDRADVPLIANDGHTIFYGPAFVDLPRSEQVGLVAHQVLHVALRHAQRAEELRRLVGDVDQQLFNICADAIVNSSLGHLDWLDMPKGSVRLEDMLRDQLGIQEAVEKSLLHWDVEALYRRVDDRRQGGGNGRRESPDAQQQTGQGGQSGGDDQDRKDASDSGDGPVSARVRAMGARIIPDLLPADAEQSRPEDAAEQTREWAERITRAHAGDGEFSMLRGLLADIPRTRIPWEQILRTRVMRGLTRKPELSWSRSSRSWMANQGRTPSGRRMPWEPGIVSSRNAPRLLLIVDVSGSIDEDLLGRFATEIEAITRRADANLVLVVGDDQVRSVQRFEPGVSNLRELSFSGGGGTNFNPLLEEACRHRPDLCLVLTDLQGPADVRPPFDVIWAVSPAHAQAAEPFGTKLVLVD